MNSRCSGGEGCGVATDTGRHEGNFLHTRSISTCRSLPVFAAARQAVVVRYGLLRFLRAQSLYSLHFCLFRSYPLQVHFENPGLNVSEARAPLGSLQSTTN